MGVGSWALLGILFLGVLTAVALAIGRNHDEHLSIVEHESPTTTSPLAQTRLS
jgi:hypothetical protein